jgi:hypothetical protein
MTEANVFDELVRGTVRRKGKRDVTDNVPKTFAWANALLRFATKDDLKQLDANHKEDIRRLDANHREDIRKLDIKIDKVEAGLKAEIDKVDTKIDKVEAGLTERMNKVEEKVDKLGLRMWHVGAAIVTAFTLIAKFFMQP